MRKARAVCAATNNDRPEQQLTPAARIRSQNQLALICTHIADSLKRKPSPDRMVLTVQPKNRTEDLAAKSMYSSAAFWPETQPNELLKTLRHPCAKHPMERRSLNAVHTKWMPWRQTYVSQGFLYSMNGHNISSSLAGLPFAACWSGLGPKYDLRRLVSLLHSRKSR